MALPSCRGAIGNGFHFSTCVGYLLANLVRLGTRRIEGWGWRISLAFPAIPASFFTVGALFFSETPYILIQREENIQKTVKTLQLMRGTGDVIAELNDVVAAGVMITQHRQRPHPWRRQWRPQLAMAVAIPFFQQATGFSLVAVHSPALFRTLGLGLKASSVAATVFGFIWLGSASLSMTAGDRIGRRPLLILGGVQMLVALAAIGLVTAAHLKNQLLIVGLLCVYVAGYGWSWGPLGWLVPSEIFPPATRSAGQSVAAAAGFIFGFVFVQTSAVLLCRLDHEVGGVFFFFAGWVGLMTALVAVFLPETRGIPIVQMGLVWGEHWFWRRVMAGGGTGDGREGGGFM